VGLQKGRIQISASTRNIPHETSGSNGKSRRI
jgi:hypothetical protein